MSAYVEVFGALLVVMALEALLLAYLWTRRRDRRASDSLIALGAGVALAAAAFAALSGAGELQVAIFLLAALAAHLEDQRRRWSHRPARDAAAAPLPISRSAK